MPLDDAELGKLEQLARTGTSVTIPAQQLLQILTVLKQLQAANATLESKLAAFQANSRNSSKPPSSDRHNPNKPKKDGDGDKDKPKRKPTGKRKPGAQKGHPGITLKQVDNPDHTVTHELDQSSACPKCGGSLRGACTTGFEKRQVFDLPEIITIKVTEHRAEKALCPCCAEKITAPFPKEVAAPVQYGHLLCSLVLYLHVYQLLPCERLCELLRDLFCCRLSPGTVCAMLKRGGARAGPVHEAIGRSVGKAEFICSDETGMSIGGKNHWLHTASTPSLVFLHIDPRRGEEAIRNMGILTDYQGFVVHDFFAAYYTLSGIRHVLCNAHLLRDLINVHEIHGQAWAQDMISLLLEAKKLQDRENAGGRKVGRKTLDRLQERYIDILAEGYQLNPEPKRRPGQRGRTPRGKALNLLTRLDERHTEIMAFLIHDGIPFDNNEAERDLRMMKIKQKISGCFRSATQAQSFAKVRSIIASAKKQSINVLAILRDTLANTQKAVDSLGCS